MVFNNRDFGIFKKKDVHLVLKKDEMGSHGLHL